jgi:hypothetical protein
MQSHKFRKYPKKNRKTQTRASQFKSRQSESRQARQLRKSQKKIKLMFESVPSERIPSESVLSEIVPVTALSPSDIIQLISNISTILSTTCLDNLGHFTSKMLHPKSCINNCCYNASGIVIFMVLMDMFPEIKNDILERNYNVTVFGKVLDETQFFMGIVNAIGLLWDVHDFTCGRKPEVDYSKYTPSGVNLALNTPSSIHEWFVEGQYPQLQKGINIVTFYVHESPNILTLHHSFVYVMDDLCILADSWCGGTMNRPLEIRTFDLVEFQNYLNIMNGYPDKTYTKMHIMHTIFKGITDAQYSLNYKLFKICIIKQSKITDLLYQAFQSSTYLFGGTRELLY